MKNKKILIVLVSALCVLSLAACGTGGNDTSNRTDTQNPTAVQGNDSLPKDSDDSNDADSLHALATIKGTVIEFSNDSCLITPTRESEDGKLAIEDAPGHENPDTAVTVHYQSGCVFKIADINIKTGIVNYSDADISDIKKQTSLIIYGDWSNKNNVNATAVYIARYE